MEIVRDIPRGRVRSALFDFDGTLSLIRAGWQEVMVAFMVERLLQLRSGESEAALEVLVREFVTELTGKQTIYQMIRLAEELGKRGGVSPDPLDLKRAYHDRLWRLIRDRVVPLREGRLNPEDWLVPGSRAVLEDLARRGIRLYLASGTDASYVLEESRLLGIDGFFQGRIHGAIDDYQNFSKKMVIEHILREHALTGPELVSFGDGFVEIENTKAVQGIAVGVASDESGRSGIDLWKRQRLIAAGADLIIPDFRCYREILDYLLPDQHWAGVSNRAFDVM